jgi:peptidoglycan L-alanyl-D-glutamate endopeptidase CwlK
VQQKLGIEVDGKPGPQTWSAIHQAVIGKSVPTTQAYVGRVDERSEKVIAKLQPEVAPYARALVARASAVGIEAKVINGLRTYSEQDELFAQGRTKPGRRVTNAKGGESNHNFGIAFDVGVFDDKAYLPESPAYDVLGAIGVELGLEWGGNWQGFVDKPHFQLRPAWADKLSERELLADLRKRVAEGRTIYD